MFGFGKSRNIDNHISNNKPNRNIKTNPLKSRPYLVSNNGRSEQTRAFIDSVLEDQTNFFFNDVKMQAVFLKGSPTTSQNILILTVGCCVQVPSGKQFGSGWTVLLNTLTLLQMRTALLIGEIEFNVSFLVL